MIDWIEKTGISKFKKFQHSSTWCVLDHPQKNLVKSVARNGIRTWDRKTGKCLQWIQLKEGDLPMQSILQVAFSYEGNFVYTCEGKIYLLLANSLKAQMCVPKANEKASRLLVSPDADTVVTRNSCVYPGYNVYSLSKGKELWSSEMEVDGLSVSPNGEYLLWHKDIIWQSGSDTIQFGVRFIKTGEALFSDEQTCWEEVPYWSYNSKYVHYDRCPNRSYAVTGKEPGCYRNVKIKDWPQNIPMTGHSMEWLKHRIKHQQES
jgi:hypothetical protein